MYRYIITITFILTVAVLLEGSRYFEQQTQLPQSSAPPAGHAAGQALGVTSTPIDFDDIKTDVTGWQTYTDSKEKYSFKYPPTAVVKLQESPEGLFEASVTVLNYPIYSDYDGNIDGVTITCCVAANADIKDLGSISNSSNMGSTTQVFTVNGHKVILETFDDNGEVTSVSIYLVVDDRVFTFYVDTLAGFNRNNYETAVNIINTFEAY